MPNVIDIIGLGDPMRAETDKIKQQDTHHGASFTGGKKTQREKEREKRERVVRIKADAAHA